MPKITQIDFATKDLDLSDDQVRERRYKVVGCENVGIVSDLFRDEYGAPVMITERTYKITKIGSWVRTDGEQKTVLIAVREDQTQLLEGLMWATEAEMKKEVAIRAGKLIDKMGYDLAKSKAEFRERLIKYMANLSFFDRLLWVFGCRPSLFPKF